MTFTAKAETIRFRAQAPLRKRLMRVARSKALKPSELMRLALVGFLEQEEARLPREVA